MEIIVASSAGFCFGVQNAIEKADKVAESNDNVYTYGPIIHNNQVVENLRSKGVNVLNDIDESGEGYKIIIRSHGISKNEYDKLKEKNAQIIDATCPYVKYIHKIVEEKYYSGYRIVIIGDRNHPEVKGINGWCSNEAIIINDEEDIKDQFRTNDKLCIVAQTTYNQDKWNSIVCRLIKLAKEIVIYNTICNATQLRQNEAMELSKKVDAMIVIGGKESSNTRKLYEICLNNCEKTFFIETEEELDLQGLSGVNKVGITAGASTPDYIIKNVINKINGIENQAVKKEIMERNSGMEEKRFSNEEQEYFMTFKSIYPGDTVEGKVISVTDKEVFVDIGYKSDGILPMEEVSGTPVDLKEKFKAGDVVTVEVIKMNDGEGNVVLSRREVEKEEYYKSINEMKDEGKTIEVIVKESNKGGLGCLFGDIKAFLPLSLSGLERGEDANSYVGKRLKVNISEVKERRDGIELIISRKDIQRKEKEERTKKFFEKLEAGQTYRGSVKSIINAGVFVNIGDVDVFVPVSELSWKRISKPLDVIAENQMVEVLIIKVNNEELKVTGSIKRMYKEPWEDFVERYREEDIIECRVARFADFGVFVELIDGVDGLIHISNLSDRRVNKPQEVVKIGQQVRAKIVKIDLETRKVNLSLKDSEN